MFYYHIVISVYYRVITYYYRSHAACCVCLFLCAGEDYPKNFIIRIDTIILLLSLCKTVKQLHNTCLNLILLSKYINIAHCYRTFHFIVINILKLLNNVLLQIFILCIFYLLLVLQLHCLFYFIHCNLHIPQLNYRNSHTATTAIASTCIIIHKLHL